MATASEVSPPLFQPGPHNGLRVLVPLDETPQAGRALDCACALIAATHGALRLIRASGFETEAGYGGLPFTVDYLRETGIDVDFTVVPDQDPVTAILQAEKTWQPDFIAMATSRRSALDRWLNGSVTDEVIRSAVVPVLVVPPSCERTLDPQRELRILVPLDGSPLAEQALPVALRLADTFGGLVILMRATRHAENDADDADAYLHCVKAQLKSVLAEGEVITHVASEEPA